jgi:hypothetical protein
MATRLGQLCLRVQFESPQEYYYFVSKLERLIKEGRMKRLEPKVRSEWDLQADFFHDPATGKIYRLHLPEFPSRGEWAEVSREYVETL